MQGAAYRPEFVAALELLARACALLEARGQMLPVLVGGAVVEFDSLGAVTSGDFDLHGGDDTAIAQALVEVGFRREDRGGRMTRGFYHPHQLIAIELVSGEYFDGQGDRDKVRLVEVSTGHVLMAPTEDLIADRIGQWEATDRRDPTLLRQALLLLNLAEALDDAYLNRRLRQESAGNMTLGGLWSLSA